MSLKKNWLKLPKETKNCQRKLKLELVDKHVLKYLIVLGFVFFITKLSAFEGDSIKKTVRVPKHYFNHTYYTDIYTTGMRKLDTANRISKQLKSYKLTQISIGFNIPIVTKDIYNADSTRISNIHFLLTGGYTRVNLNFGGIDDHRLSKTAIGFRALYNNGKRSIFFAELSPFSTKDIGHSYTRTTRLAFTLLYNYSVNEFFSFRLGYTRSFLWGNRFNLPYIGVRVGKLDKINISIQFPRSFSLIIPLGKYVRTSIYAKPQGGLFAFANNDSLKIGDINNNNKLYFGRNEFLSGWRVDLLPSKYFNFYLSSGLTTSNIISFTAPATAKNSTSPYKDYYRQKIKPSLFINLGFTLRFGKTKSIYNNYQLYNAIDMNNGIDIGDNNVNPGNGNIPVLSKKIKVNNPDEVLDLIEAQDLY